MLTLRQTRIMMLLILGTAAITSGAWAQDPQEPQDQGTPEKPKPAARGIPPINDPNATVENTDDLNIKWQPDTSPATGLQSPTLGSPELAHSYWVPGLVYGSTIQSRPLGQLVPNSGWYADNYVGGQLSLLEAWGRAQLALNYSGGGYFSTNSLESNGWFQELSAAQNITLNRWQIQLFDTFSYIPESQFGFAGGTDLALPGISGTLGPTVPGLGASIVPNQSIYSALGPRYSNAFAAQATYLLSRRGSLTLGGSYGLLHYSQSGNVDNNMALGSVGYNYALTSKDSIGFLYRFAGYHFAGEPQALGSHTANFVYSRKIARRLALDLFGGPQITYYRVPIGTATRNTGLSAGASINYAVQHGSIVLSYFHGLTGGSGILLGSTADQVTGVLGHQLGRVWTGNVNFGYARDISLASTPTIPEETFDDWFVGAGISRPIGRNVNFSASYSARVETTNLPICVGTVCSSSYTQHLISLTLQWHTRPFVLP
jgi:hypothetical protein